MDELKPCKCEESPLIIFPNNEADMWWIVCRLGKCDTYATGKTKQETIQAWNRRWGDDQGKQS